MKYTIVLSSALLFLGGCSTEHKSSAQEKQIVSIHKEEKKEPVTEQKSKVIQTIHSGGYTYVELQEGTKQYWIAGPQTELKKGDIIEYDKQMVMPRFTSNTLGRTFENLLFVSAIYKEGEPRLKQTQTNPHPVAMQKISVQTASSGIKIVDLFTQKEKFKGSEVLFHAQVVKVTKDVMAKDWIHLQDGSGEQGTHDIIATAQNTDLKVGDRVSVRGKLHTDLNLGAGYNYPVIIQEASFKAL